MTKAQMKVELLFYTPEPEKLIVVAARNCYSSKSILELLNNITETEQRNMILKLIEMGHESPLEHVSFTFGIEGVSRSLLTQLTRHRIASYSVKSQRYISEVQFNYIIPPEIDDSPEAREIFLKAMEEDQQKYNQINSILFKKHYHYYLSRGQTEEKARTLAEKKAIEDARFVLPNACETKLVMTMNARSLYNFFQHRCCNRAQWEIRQLANEIYNICLNIAPNIFKYAGPECKFGQCKQGELSCKIERCDKYAD